MNIHNLFEYCDKNITTENNSIYYIGPKLGNSLFVISIDIITNKIHCYSNEWLSLIKCYYPIQEGIYNNIVNISNTIISSKNVNITIIDEHVLPLITSFSLGTTHGYCGLFYVLLEYVKNYELYKDLKLLVYINSQQGILDIINHLINKNILNKEKIIYVNSNIKYLFKKITFIPNKYHGYNNDLTTELEPYINDWIINDKNNIIYYNNLNLPSNDNICIIKNSQSINLTHFGIVNINDINNFCYINNITFVEPILINEISFIHIINKSKKIILSYGTSFFKNYVYISDKCKKIIVLVIGEIFLKDYTASKNHNQLLTNYKNAVIEYHVVPSNLIFDYSVLN